MRVSFVQTQEKKGYFVHGLCRNIYKLNTSLKDRRHWFNYCINKNLQEILSFYGPPKKEEDIINIIL